MLKKAGNIIASPFFGKRATACLFNWNYPITVIKISKRNTILL